MTQFLLATLVFLAASPVGKQTPYSNDFSKAPLGKPSDEEFLALSGEFAVKDVDGNRVLELSPVPLDSLGALFGPASETGAGTIAARIWAASTGKRVPEFGVGLGDAGGYKLWLIPRQKLLFIRKGDVDVASVAYVNWHTETWTQLRLEVAKANDGWIVRGKVWADGSKEPADWTITLAEKDQPPSGRASLWANPYSDQPIRFDDLLVNPGSKSK